MEELEENSCSITAEACLLSDENVNFTGVNLEFAEACQEQADQLVIVKENSITNPKEANSLIDIADDLKEICFETDKLDYSSECYSGEFEKLALQSDTEHSNQYAPKMLESEMDDLCNFTDHVSNVSGSSVSQHKEKILSEKSSTNGSVNSTESDVSDPLKHLLSLHWEVPVTSSNLANIKIQSTKKMKKVHFADEVEETLRKDSEDPNAKNTYSNVLNENSSEDLQTAIHVEDSKNLEVTATNKDSAHSCNAQNESKITLDLIEVDEDINSDIDLFDLNKPHLKNLLDTYQDQNNILEDNIYNLATHISSISLISSSKSNDFLEQNQASKEFSSECLINTSNTSGIMGNIESTRTVQPMEDLHHFDKIAKKRETGKKCNWKQSWRLNCVLDELNSSNAYDLKIAAFKAWCRVKSEAKTYNCNSVLIKTKEHLNKSVPKQAYLQWKKYKTKTLQSTKKDVHKDLIACRTSHESDDNAKEREIAFQAWKRRKDEILKKQSMEIGRRQHQIHISSLMNATEKKNDAESAFLSWKANKSHVLKIEKKKKAWALKKEEEELEKMMLKDKEALQMYYLWLENKHPETANTYCNYSQIKSPWFPPGKAFV